MTAERVMGGGDAVAAIGGQPPAASPVVTETSI